MYQSNIENLGCINIFSLTVVDSLEQPNIRHFTSDFFSLFLGYKCAKIK